MGRRALAALLALALIMQTVCQDDDDYGGGDDDYGGGGGDDEEGYGEPPPPPGEVRELFTVADFEQFVDDADASVIGAFTAKEIVDPDATVPEGWDEEEDGPWSAPTIENPALASFTSISSTTYGYRFAFSVAPEVLEKLKSKAGGVYLYRSPKFVSKEHGDRPRERFPSGKLSESAVSNWLEAKAQPLVGLYSHSTKSRYKNGVLTIFMNLDFDQNAKSVNYVLKRARKVAAALKGKIGVAVAALADSTDMLADYGLESTKPSSDIVFGISKNYEYYGATGVKFTADAITDYANKFLAGELTPYVKPDPPIPEDDPPSDDDAMGEDAPEEEDDVKDEP